MIILSAKDITKTYGTDVILDRVSFHINEGDRVGIIGINGAGKTTLLNILAGKMDADDGDFFVSQNTSVGYLRQKDDFERSNTVMEQVHSIFAEIEAMEQQLTELATRIGELGEKADRTLLNRYANLQDQFKNRGGFTYKSEIKGILNSMAFGEDYYDKPISTLSGGERTRLALACLLLEKPNLLFLDEPTNHLDIGTLKWLEQYLKGYKGTIVLVSHDRYFLDQTVNKIFEVENHRLTIYEGNYSTFADKKRSLREAQLRAYTNQQREIRRQEDMIRRFKERGTEKLAKRAASREKRLDNLQRIDKPEAQAGKVKIQFRQNYQSGSDVIFAEGLSKSFGVGGDRRDLFSNVNLDIKRGERVCIVGANGIGKTTLLKLFMEELSPTAGYIKIGHNVDIGYYDQRQQLLDDNSTVMDEIHDTFRLYKDGEIRGLLGRFLFKDDQVFLKVGSLSGGEKARLSLLKLMMGGANLLLLDEPTNHLDIDSKEVFEEALMDYPGTVIAVSHDRYFLNKIPTRILELGRDGITQYLGSYDYYVEKKESVDSGKAYLKSIGNGENGSGGSGETGGGAAGTGTCKTQIANADSSTSLSAAEERLLKKKLATEQKRYEKEKARLESLIEELENKISEIEGEMCKPENISDSKKLREMDAECRNIKEKLEKTYELWMEM